MKILFVCGANVGRSQIAESYFNKFSKKHKAISAGEHTSMKEYNGEKLKVFAMDIVGIMKEEGIDISEKVTKQLTKEMIDSCDKIIVLGERENLPDYIDKSKVAFWSIPDLNHMPHKIQQEYRDRIKKLVLKLIKEIG